MNSANEHLPPQTPTDLAQHHPATPTPEATTPDVQGLDTNDQTHFGIRRMTHQDRVDAYQESMDAYRKWQADPNHSGFYRIPKHPDEEDREFREAQERRLEEARKRRASGFMFIAPFIIRRP